MTILVVGATGQLGLMVTRQLSEAGLPVRALVRPGAALAPLEQIPGVELVQGDLSQAGSLAAACDGVYTIIATANAAFPRHKHDKLEKVDGQGYLDLISAADVAGVEQFIYSSTLETHLDSYIPTYAWKRKTEKALQNSRMVYSVFRAAQFMELAFALMGSPLPLRGVENPTFERPYRFGRNFYQGVKHDMQKKGQAQIPGKGKASHAYLAMQDMAAFLVNSVQNPAAENVILDVGGPQALTPLEVKALFEDVLGKPLKARTTPGMAYNMGMFFLSGLAPHVANLMGMHYAAATQNGLVPRAAEQAERFGVTLTPASHFLAAKARISG